MHKWLTPQNTTYTLKDVELRGEIGFDYGPMEYVVEGPSETGIRRS